MNFFGHAVIASRSDAARGSVRAEFVLGSMLPDFASMLRMRPPRVTSRALEEGLRHHHATDDAFHGSESFLEFSRHASIFLGARGLSRGSARAVAHVGVELIVDGALDHCARMEAVKMFILSIRHAGTGPDTSRREGSPAWTGPRGVKRSCSHKGLRPIRRLLPTK